MLYAPAVLLIKAFVQEQLFYGEMLHITGETSARLLMITMAITIYKHVGHKIIKLATVILQSDLI